LVFIAFATFHCPHTAFYLLGFDFVAKSVWYCLKSSSAKVEPEWGFEFEDSSGAGANVGKGLGFVIAEEVRVIGGTDFPLGSFFIEFHFLSQ